MFILISTEIKVILISILIRGLKSKLYYLDKFATIIFYLKGRTNNKAITRII